jgi:hypothetical protein
VLLSQIAGGHHGGHDGPSNPEYGEEQDEERNAPPSAVFVSFVVGGSRFLHRNRLQVAGIALWCCIHGSGRKDA